MLANPCPINSWLGSIFCPVLTEILLAIEIASINPKRDIIAAIGKKPRQTLKSILGTEKAGIPFGISPTTEPPPVIIKLFESSTLDLTLILHILPSVLRFAGTEPCL